MFRSAPAAKSKRQRLKELPWAALLQATFVIARRWRGLSQKDRARLTRLVGDSRGRLGNLSTKERVELRRLVGKLDIKGMGRELTALTSGGRRRKRRRGAA